MGIVIAIIIAVGFTAFRWYYLFIRRTRGQVFPVLDRHSPPWQKWLSSALVVLVFVIVILSRQTYDWSRPRVPESVIAVLASLLAIGTLVLIYGIVRSRPSRHFVESYDYQVCPSCNYPLKGLPIKHTCPECGKAYDLNDVQRTWAARFRGFPRR